MSRKLPAINAGFWKRLRYRGVPLKQHLLAGLPACTAPLLRERALRSFKQGCAAEGNILPLLISELEPQDQAPGMFRRRGPRKRRGSDPFEDLPFLQRLDAENTFSRLCEKWAGNLPSWRRAILAGVARRLTLHPPGSEWGRRMRRIKGGVHCQRKYREGGWHPLTAFNQAMAKRRNEAAANNSSEQMRAVATIAPLLQSIPGGLESAIEGLRWSEADDAIAFLQRYDSISPAYLEHLNVDEICVAVGLDPRRLLCLAVDGMLKVSVLKVTARLVLSLPAIADATIQNALTPKGGRDRRLILESVGIAPARPRKSIARMVQPQVPSLAEVLNRPAALPGKVG